MARAATYASHSRPVEVSCGKACRPRSHTTRAKMISQELLISMAMPPIEPTLQPLRAVHSVGLQCGKSRVLVPGAHGEPHP